MPVTFANFASTIMNLSLLPFRRLGWSLFLLVTCAEAQTQWSISPAAPQIGTSCSVSCTVMNSSSSYALSMWAQPPSGALIYVAGGGSALNVNATVSGTLVTSLPGTWSLKVCGGINATDVTLASTNLVVTGSDLTISATTYASGQTITIRVSDSITTSGAVVVSSGANVSYIVDNEAIRLEPGFKAVSGSVFRAFLLPTADADHDGMPNDWELAHGLNPTLASDATADPDGDKVSNLIEYRLGLAPHDATDANVQTFTYDKTNQLIRGPGGEYGKDEEGNIQSIQK